MNWGVSLVSISGAQLKHIRAWLEQNSFLRKYLKAFILSFGGNDLFEVGPPVLSEAIMNLVREISRGNKHAAVVTGSIIPRMLMDEGIMSVRASEHVDHLISKASVQHHHFETDAFQSDAKEPKVIGSLYAPDGTHLNRSGNDVFKSVLSFIFDSLNFGDFSGGQTRVISWKF